MKKPTIQNKAASDLKAKAGQSPKKEEALDAKIDQQPKLTEMRIEFNVADNCFVRARKLLAMMGAQDIDNISAKMAEGLSIYQRLDTESAKPKKSVATK